MPQARHMASFSACLPKAMPHTYSLYWRTDISKGTTEELAFTGKQDLSAFQSRPLEVSILWQKLHIQGLACAGYEPHRSQTKRLTLKQ